MEKVAPAIFLPFFVLTGASLQLDDVHRIIFVATCVCLLRVVAIFSGSTSSGIMQKLCGLHSSRTEIKYMWLTLLSQAGVALGLAISTKEQFPAWGQRFETLVISVVVLNQIIGPVLCKIGMLRMESSSSGRSSSRSSFEMFGDDIDDESPTSMQRRKKSRDEEVTSRFLRSNTVDELDTLVLKDGEKEELQRLVPDRSVEIQDLNSLLEKHGYGSLSQLASRFDFSHDGTSRRNIKKRSPTSRRPVLKRSSSSGLFFRDVTPESPSDSEVGM